MYFAYLSPAEAEASDKIVNEIIDEDDDDDDDGDESKYEHDAIMAAKCATRCRSIHTHTHRCKYLDNKQQEEGRRCSQNQRQDSAKSIALAPCAALNGVAALALPATLSHSLSFLPLPLSLFVCVCTRTRTRQRFTAECLPNAI